MDYTMSSPTADQLKIDRSVLYAGFWRRFLAAFIDGLLVGIIYVIVMFTIGTGLYGIGSMNAPAAGSAAMAAAVMLMIAISLAGAWLYYALMESSSNQATLGKMALGLRVTDLDGKRISFGKATARYFAKFLSGLTISIGYIMAGFTQKKQALHDFVAGTLVLTKQSSVPAQVAANAFAS